VAFKIGDVVRLKSGGPDMVIQEIDEVNGTAVCRWFDGKKDKREEFVLETLELAKPKAMGVVALSSRG
jgi:uncharacterized protein YodC (DUF2158 family)